MEVALGTEYDFSVYNCIFNFRMICLDAVFHIALFLQLENIGAEEPPMKKIKSEHAVVEESIAHDSITTETITMAMAPDVIAQAELVEEQAEEVEVSDDLRNHLEGVQQEEVEAVEEAVVEQLSEES